MSELILSAISDDAPCGIDFKYEDAYLKLENELDKSNSLSEDITTDWATVKASSLELLEKHTKDTKLFCWWMYSVWKTESWQGFKTSLELFNMFLQTFGKALFPKSKKIKISALLWLEEQINAEVLDEQGTLNATIETKVFLELFENLQKHFIAVVEDEVSIFVKIQNDLNRQLSAHEAKAAKNQPTATSTSQLTERNEINSEEDAKAVLRSLKKSANLLQKHYRAQKASDLRAIRLVRLLSTLEVDGVPMNENGKTFLNPIASNQSVMIETLMAEEKYVEALEKTESIICASPFWFEGHYKSFEILSAMGEANTAQEVMSHFISFVNNNETFYDLSFKDGSPFISSVLKQWIQANSKSAKTNAQECNTDETTQEEIIEASYALARKQQIKEAMGLLQVQHNNAVTKEEKFYWRLANAKLAAEFNKNNLSLALLEDLRADVDKYHLDDDIVNALGNINNGFGGLAAGMEYADGTFALSNSKGVHLKHYESGWTGNQYVKTYSMAKWGSRLSNGTLVVSLLIGGYQINSAMNKDEAYLNENNISKAEFLPNVGEGTEQQVGSTLAGFGGGSLASAIAIGILNLPFIPVEIGVGTTVAVFVVVGGAVGWVLSKAGNEAVDVIQDLKGSTIFNDYPLSAK